MSPPGRPKGELLPLGGTARSAKGAPVSPPGEAQARRACRRANARAADRAPHRMHRHNAEAA
jgi:hypothetical protein